VQPVEDPFYPTEERDEAAAAAVPAVSSIGDGSCVLHSPAGESATAKPGDVIFGEWTLQSIIPATGGVGGDGAQLQRPAVVVMERRWKRWGLLVFATVKATTQWDVQLRKPLGADLADIRSLRYDNLTKNDPLFFQKV
jgi:hypothetical protein